MSTFVDTSIWFAAVNANDIHNERAKRILAAIAAPTLTDHVLVETWCLVNSKVHRRAAEQFWLGIRQGAAQLEKVTIADLETAWAIGEAFADQDFSIVDRTSFAVMERLGIRQVATFDKHFAIYRYGFARDRAFEPIGLGYVVGNRLTDRRQRRSKTYQLIRRAIRKRQQVTCIYQGYYRELCPHIIGHRDKDEVVLAFQFGGESERGLPPAGQWRCLYLSEVSEAQVRGGDWHTGAYHRTTQNCVDIVDLDINVAARR